VANTIWTCGFRAQPQENNVKNKSESETTTKTDSSLTRRRLLQGAGGVFAAAVLPTERPLSAAFPPRQESSKAPATTSATINVTAIRNVRIRFGSFPRDR
jgi:hypothetical protein